MRSKMYFISVLLSGLLILTGCATFFKSSGKNTKSEEKARTNVENVEGRIVENNKDKMEELKQLTYGTGYALEKEENPSKNVEVAKELNTRAQSLTGVPTLDEVKKMRQLIDDLTSELNTERERGQKTLEEKDAEIKRIQANSALLVEAKDAEIRKYMKIAADTASKADVIQGKLNQMDSFFGLGAVFYGLKKFVISMAWILGGLSLLYIILRFAAMSNPIAASIFSIFDIAMSWFVHVIKLLAPKALEVAGHTTTAISNQYRDIVVKMVDGIESLKEKQAALGDSGQRYTLNELLLEFSKLMDSNEKAIVMKIKHDIGYR